MSLLKSVYIILIQILLASLMEFVGPSRVIIIFPLFYNRTSVTKFSLCTNVASVREAKWRVTGYIIRLIKVHAPPITANPV